MRVPLEWLHEYCAPHMDVHTLAERLALTGTEVERIEHHGVMAIEHFVIGKVLERHKHPDADRLSVCMVDVGGSTPSQIVCGAPNVAAGQTVGVARPGSVMPDGTELRKAKLRGQESDGMILAEDEVGIGMDHNGIMILSDVLVPGMPLRDVLPISTDVLVLEITPNRPDCLGIYGVAREVAAATGAQLKPPPWEYDPGSLGTLEGVEVINEAGPELCQRFTARVFDDIKIGPSPYWLKARLMACGMRPISNVVDITNYVMLMTGQPMHAYDNDKVAGGRLVVRRAVAGETIETLDGQQRTVSAGAVVIADDDGPTGVAGVMGGARSEVSESTGSVLSEVATWNGGNVHSTSLALALRSEASNRYEKQLQPEQALWAQAIATNLFTELCGATVRPGTIDVGGPGPAPVTLRLRHARVEGLLGAAVKPERARNLLETIGFTVIDAPDGLDVTVPDFRRADITREADLIEEVARLDGLDNLPATLPARRAAVGALTAVQKLRRRIGDLMAAQGFDEMIGWSFNGPELAGRLRQQESGAVVKLANPMSGDQSQLRISLLGSLLDVVQRNHARGVERIRLFELGAVYSRRDLDSLAQEPIHLGALASGPVRAGSWRASSPPAADFFAAKGALAAVLDALRVQWSLELGGDAFLHPGRSARVLVGGNVIGWVGELHPGLVSDWDLSGILAGFEIDLDQIQAREPATYQDLTSFPELREDLAVIVGETVPAQAVVETILKAGQPLLAGAEVFDVYRDQQRLGEGNVSLALRLAYRASDRTLTDAEVARQRQLIVNALSQELGGRIRDGE